MSAPLHIFLVPGFFGFANLGELVYFGHVHAFLTEALAREGVDATVVQVLSHPTASIRERAKDLLATVAQTAGADDGPIHFIGHSTGGLDARFLLSPGTAMGEGPALEPIARRVRSVVCVSTPHRGTPLASFFQGLAGQRLLQLLSLFTAAVLRRARMPLALLFKLAGSLVRADDALGFRATLVDQLFESLLADLSKERQQALLALLAQMGKDQSLISQLTPEQMALFAAGTPDRETVRYASVVTRASAPNVHSFVEGGLDPYVQTTHLLYSFLHGQSRGLLRAPLRPDHRAVLEQAYGALPEPDDNDGIVPTRSQPYGELLAAVQGDHLDVLGHYDGANEQPPHVDWLMSGSGFRYPAFERVWRAVLGFVLSSS